MDDELARNPSDENETPDPELWDRPGRDGIVTDAESDPDHAEYLFTRALGWPSVAVSRPSKAIAS